MQQLECRFYSRQEIAEILCLNPTGNSHFAEQVRRTLNNWGYQYQYARQGITITTIPETAEQRLTEILIRQFGLDKQIDPFAFSCFLCAFNDIDGFHSMPWEERAEMLNQAYHISVCDRTLRNWCKCLIGQDVITATPRQSWWRTEYINGIKCRESVPEDDEEMQRFFARRGELLDKEKLSWKETMSRLWREFQCCYYSCKGFFLNAIDQTAQECLYEIYELTQEIAVAPAETAILTKEDFRREWYHK